MLADPLRVALVCAGNICRSPMAHVVLEETVDQAGLSGRVQVSSAGTGHWHVGDPMDPRAAATLLAEGYDPSAHRARQFDAGWFADHDLVLVMDHDNLHDVGRLGAAARAADIRMFRSFDPVGADDDEVPDPYYGGEQGFTDVLLIVERTARGVVAWIERQLRDDPDPDPPEPDRGQGLTGQPPGD